jgi:hypothetical protein
MNYKIDIYYSDNSFSHTKHCRSEYELKENCVYFEKLFLLYPQGYAIVTKNNKLKTIIGGEQNELYN